MNLEKIILWSGWIITVVSFLVNIFQYFHFKELNSKYRDIIKNATVLLEGIDSSLNSSINAIERPSPPIQADIAIASLKGAVRSVLSSINSWLKYYGSVDFVVDKKEDNQANSADAKSRAAD